MPRILWQVHPASDAVTAAALLAAGQREFFMQMLPLTEIGNGDVGAIVNEGVGLVLTRAGGFRWLSPHLVTVEQRAPLLVFGDDRVTYQLPYHLSSTPMGGWPEVVNALRDLALPSSPSDVGLTGTRLPAVDFQGNAYWHAGSDWVVSSCLTTQGFRWALRFDTSRMDEPPGRVVLADDGTVLLGYGGPLVYRFSADGELLGSLPAAPGGERREQRHLLGHVAGCGAFVALHAEEASRFERWSLDGGLERTWSMGCHRGWDPPCAVDYRQVAPTADCGLLWVDRPTSARGRLDFVVRWTAEGREAWRTPIDPGSYTSLLPPFPLADGGALFFVDRTLWRLRPGGAIEWRWEVPGGGSVVDKTPLLTADGTLFFAYDQSVGDYSIVAAATGATPGPMAWYDSAQNPRRTSATIWE